MKVLLVNPDVPETFWGLKNALKFISKKAILPPLGLLTVAGMLPKDWETKLLDMTTTRLRDRDIQWADCVFVTAMLIQQKSADQVIERCKKLATRVAVGGPLFTSLPEQYVHVDHLVLKEAELTLPLFIKDLQEDCARKVYNTHDRADLCETPYCERIKTFLKNYEASSNKKARIRFNEIRILLKSLWHIGVLSKDRRYYWRLIFWASRRRHYLRMSVILSIQGYHFRKIFKGLQQRAESLVRDSQTQLTGLTSQTRQSPVLLAEKNTNAEPS